MSQAFVASNAFSIALNLFSQGAFYLNKGGEISLKLDELSWQDNYQRPQ